MDVKDTIDKCIGYGVLISPDTDAEKVGSILEALDDRDVAVINNDIIDLLSKDVYDANWKEIERLKVLHEKKGMERPYLALLSCLSKNDSKRCATDKVEVLFNYEKPIEKKDIKNFVAYFNNRFRDIERILSQRQELQNLTSISRIAGKKDKENVSVIGIVNDKRETGNGNIIVSLEDTTGIINVLINKNKPELYETAKDIVMDEVIGVVGVSGDNIIFSNNIILPEIPLNKEIKKSPTEEYAIFLSDIHIGSDTFMKDDFEKFLSWLNGNIGSEKQKELTKKIRYVFIAGDMVDGVGIYPGQEDELVIKDIYEQYKECARYLSMIPKHMQIIVCPGNHDASRLSEPQPALMRDFIKPLTDISNLTMISNPGVVNIGRTDDFPGFDVLLYHGYSFDYYVANVDGIRNNGGYDRADLIMKFLLQRRHLAPSHKSTLYVPDVEEDPLVIKKIPDFFVSGHIHKVAVSSYRGVSLICGSCWQSITKFQEKLGHHPEPARVPLVNLQTRETKILRF